MYLIVILIGTSPHSQRQYHTARLTTRLRNRIIINDFATATSRHRKSILLLLSFFYFDDKQNNAINAQYLTTSVRMWLLQRKYDLVGKQRATAVGRRRRSTIKKNSK